MGWFKTTPLTARSGTGGVSISMIKPPSAGVPTLRLRLGRRVMAATGWADGQAVELLFGDDQDVGKVMLRPAEGDGGSRLRAPPKRSPSSIDTTFGYLPRDPIAGTGGAQWSLLQEPHPAVEVDWSHAENALLITVPREWWAVTGTKAAIEKVAAEVYAETRRDPAPPPPRPAADDRIERVISMLERGLSTEEVRQHERCSPQFVHDCRAMLAKRKPGHVHPGQRSGVQPQMAGTRERAVNGGAA